MWQNISIQDVENRTGFDLCEEMSKLRRFCNSCSSYPPPVTSTHRMYPIKPRSFHICHLAENYVGFLSEIENLLNNAI